MKPRRKSILIIKPSSLGDVVHTLPAVAAIRDANPDAEITWVINPEWATILRGNRDVDHVHIFIGINCHASGVEELPGSRAGISPVAKQLAIGRALVTQPRLLLLDEPTEGIQPSIVFEIEAALTRVRKELGVAVLLVEQYLDFAWSFADRFFVMQKGRIVDRGLTRERTTESVERLLSV